MVLILVFILSKKLFIKFHKLYTDPLLVKYTICNSDQRFLDKYSKESKIYLIKSLNPGSFVFYINKKWSTKNNNYMLFKDRYYIIEPGYYYITNKNTKLFLNNNCKIKIKELNRNV